jgi:hypothetical protein
MKDTPPVQDGPAQRRWKKQTPTEEALATEVAGMREAIAAAVANARAHAWLGYKRLAWVMIDGDVANLRPGQVYDILAKHDLLGRRTPAPAALVRPAEADHPDQRWHTDLMSVRIRGRWLWLIDVLDAYSRYLVFWEILLWAQADAVTLAVQRALETLDHPAYRGNPRLCTISGVSS